MDLWLSTEIQNRRDDALAQSRNSRLAQIAATGRSSKLRVVVAEAVQMLSEALAAFARSLRNGEAA
jgi:hypothetical protein